MNSTEYLQFSCFLSSTRWDVYFFRADVSPSDIKEKNIRIALVLAAQLTRSVRVYWTACGLTAIEMVHFEATNSHSLAGVALSIPTSEAQISEN